MRARLPDDDADPAVSRGGRAARVSSASAGALEAQQAADAAAAAAAAAARLRRGLLRLQLSEADRAVIARRIDDGAADDGADLAAYVAALARDAARPRVPLLDWVVAVPARELAQLQPTPIELENPAACGLFGGGMVGACFSSRL